MLFCNQLVSHPSFKNLESLKIWNCKNGPHCLFRDVVSDDALSVKEEEERVIHNSLFPHLKYLDLNYLPELRCVVSLNMQKVPFPNLKYLYVDSCQRLLHFSSLSVARTSLQLVDSIHFMGCNEMEQVFVLEEDEPRCGNQSQIRDIRFPMLNTLVLLELPALTAFCKGINSIDFPNLTDLWIGDLNNIKGFVTEDAEQSNESGFLFGSKVSFGRLEWLEIRQCSQIEFIIGEDEEGQGMNKKPLFPELYDLKLEDLPKLRSFSQRKHALHFPSLKKVVIKNCNEMQTFAQGYISTPKLRKLELNGIPFPVNDINNSIRQHFDEEQANAEKIEVVAEEIMSEEEMDEKIEIMEQVTEQITSEE